MEDVGAYLLEAFPHLSVDVHNPNETIWIEIREDAAFIHPSPLPGAGGLPAGTAGKAALLLSGGIDSPVAGFLCARRGLALIAVHFFSHPYTAPEAKDKVLELAKILSGYTGPMAVYCLPFTEIQETLRRLCPEDYFTILSRRMMMRAAERIAQREECGAIITGESLAQVASQTLPSLAATDTVCHLPVLRPLIGLDKEEIIQRARKIGTYATSILPYEDCCTVFSPKHPKTRPTRHQTEAAERRVPIETLLRRCIHDAEKVVIYD
jgi:thiamine biosynthesis protein ThiI